MMNNCSEFQNNNEYVYDNFISLGADCGVSRALRGIKYKDATYPFDWTITKIKGLLYAFENNFTNFIIEKNKLQKIGNDGFCNDDKTIYFPHEYKYFELTNNDTLYISQMNKYNRRIERLNLLLNSNKKIVFVRKCFDETTDDILKLVDIISKKYPTLYFHLIFFSSDKQNDILNNNKHVTHHYVDKYYLVKYNKNHDTYFHSHEVLYYAYFQQIIKNFRIKQTFSQVPIKNDKDDI